MNDISAIWLEEPGDTKSWTIPAIHDSVDTDPTLTYPEGICGPKVLTAAGSNPNYLAASYADPSDTTLSDIVFTYTVSLASESDIGPHDIEYEVSIADYSQTTPMNFVFEILCP